MLSVLFAAAVLPPPRMVVSAPPVSIAPAPAVTTVDVAIRAGSRMLWQGTLRVDPRAGESSYSQSVNEAPPAECARPSNFMAGQATSLRLGLSTYASSGDEAERPMLRYSVQWTRPSDECASGVGQRGVQLSGQTRIVRGSTAELSGDGGLVLRLTPR